MSAEHVLNTVGHKVDVHARDVCSISRMYPDDCPRFIPHYTLGGALESPKNTQGEPLS